jgi:hypothetical protein
MLSQILTRVYKLARVDVFKKLNRERMYQQSKWSPAASGNEGGICVVTLKEGEEGVLERYHEIGAWISYMMSYLREAQDLDAHGDNHKEALAKIRCVTAMGVACLEQHGCPDREESPERRGDHAHPPAEFNKTDVLRTFLSSLIPDCKLKDCPIHGS